MRKSENLHKRPAAKTDANANTTFADLEENEGLAERKNLFPNSSFKNEELTETHEKVQFFF